MSFFTATDIAALKAVHVSTFDQTCRVVTPGTMTADGAGGFTEGTPTTADVLCRVDALSASEAEVAARLSQTVDAVVTMPVETAIAATQRITIPSSGEVYEVVKTNTIPAQSWRTSTQADVRRIR